MSDDEDKFPLPPDLRFLKWLTGTLAGVMILGLLTITGLLVTRLNTPAPLPALPEWITLPDDAQAEAITFARDWLIVVTDRNTALLYDRRTHALVQSIPLP